MFEISPESQGWRPRLRADVELVRAEPGAPITGLNDKLIRRELTFPPLAGEIATLLDGTRELADIVRESRELAPELPESEVEGTLRSFLLLGAVEGAGDSTRERVRAHRAGESPPVSFLEGARFECQCCGACCHNYLYGPLVVEDLKTLQALDLSGFPNLPPGPPYFVMEGGAEGKQAFLRSTEGRCAFQDDGSCGLHQRFGAQAKPFACRKFPIKPILTFEGIKLGDVGECAELAVSSSRGPLLEEHFASEEFASLKLWHPGLMLPGRIPCDFGFLAPVEAALVERLGHEPGGTGSALLLVAGVLKAFCDRLARCPVAPGEPDATIARLVAEVREGAEFSVPTTQEGALAATNALTSAFLGAVLPSALNVETNPLVTLARGAMQALAEPLLLLRLMLDGQRGMKVDPEGTRILGLPVQPNADDVLRLSLRQQLFNESLLVDGRVGAGVIRLAAVRMVSLVGAKLRAASLQKTEVGPLEMSWAHHVAQRGLRGPRFDPLFGDEECRTWDYAAAAAGLG